MLRVILLAVFVAGLIGLSYLPAAAGGWSGDRSSDIRDDFAGGIVLSDIIDTLDR